jgi:chemotaxis protein MotB
MSRRKKNGGPVNHERWLVSYADFITLLFAVFVVMYAASQTDHRKIGKISIAIQVAFQELGLFQASTTRMPLNEAEPMPFADAQMVENIDRSISFGTIAPDMAAEPSMSSAQNHRALHDKLMQALAPEMSKKQIELHETPEGLVLSLHEMGFYAPGSDVLIETSRPTLDKLVPILAPTGYSIRVEGHTDNVPIHNGRFSSNWELSAARSTGLVRVFIERYKFQPSLLAAAGYGEYHPVQPNSTPEGRSTNRRVDLVILAPSQPVSAQQKFRLQESLGKMAQPPLPKVVDDGR